MKPVGQVEYARGVMRGTPFVLLSSLLGACVLDVTPLPGNLVAEDGGAGDGGDGGGDDGGGDGGQDAGTGCRTAVSAPAEVTLGARVTADAGLVCADDPASHTCAWRVSWNDDNDEVPTIVVAEHACAAGESVTFAAAAVSDDPSSFYRVSLTLDRDLANGQPRVFVGQFEIVAGTESGLEGVNDIAIDPAARRAWLATDGGLAAMLLFSGPQEGVVQSAEADCDETVVRCVQHTVAVAGGRAWSGVDADQDAIVRADIEADEVVSETVDLPERAKTRAIVASRADGADDDPGLYVSSDQVTWTIARSALTAGNLSISDELGTNGDDLSAIVATAVEVSDDGNGEALWRVSTGGEGRVQRLNAIDDPLQSIAPEDIVDHNGSAVAVFQRLVVVAQRDGRAFAVDLDALDLGGDTPLEDASAPLELPLTDDPDGTMENLDDVVDLFVSEDGETLWAVSPDTLYRVTDGTVFRSDIGDLPAAMRSVAVLEDRNGAEVILIGTTAGLYISRANLHD